MAQDRAANAMPSLSLSVLGGDFLHGFARCDDVILGTFRKYIYDEYRMRRLQSLNPKP